MMKGKIQALIFSKLARLARNTMELLEISDFFQKYHANLVSLEESLDTSTPAGRLLYTVIGALAQWEREEISARVAASIPIRAQQGKPTGGIGPFGYIWNDDRRLVLNPEEAPTVKRAFELYLLTGRLLSTCEILNQEGYRARKGQFRPVTLKRILTDSVYKGMKRANYSKSKGHKKSWVLKPEKEWIYVPVDPIIEEQVWNEVNVKIFNNSKNSKKNIPKEGKYLFSGKVICSCQNKIYVSPYKGMKIPRYICRKCRFKINEDMLEYYFKIALEKMIVEPQELQMMVNYKEEWKEKEKRLYILKKEMISVDLRIDTLVDLFSTQAIDRKNFTERFSPLKERKEQIEKEVCRLKSEIEFAKNNSISKDSLIDRTTTFFSLWPGLDDSGKRRLVEDLVDRVEVGDDRLNFIFSYNQPVETVVKDTRNFRGSSQPPS